MSVLRVFYVSLVGWRRGGEVGDGRWGVAFPVVLFWWCCKPRGPAVELGALQQPVLFFFLFEMHKYSHKSCVII